VPRGSSKRGGSFLRPLPHIPLVQRQGEEDLAGMRSAAVAVSSVLSLTFLSDDEDGDDGGAVEGLAISVDLGSPSWGRL
jgi:hypothetical protein